ncbi:MAG: anaerobic ribonucleoside-triphosphate reductase [Patescibacteria group bacterium]|nr:anaerobic ribonucleoside-triphosphate reductase [Patescibacteria group bacterium]
MASVKNVKNKNYCWDCKKEIKFKEKEIKNGRMLTYETGREKVTIFKCNDCFSKSKELKNFQTCEVYSRVVGYLRPVQQWNIGKQKEFEERKEFNQRSKIKN